MYILVRINIIVLVGTLRIISTEKILQPFVRLFDYSHKDNIKMFWYYSRNILINQRKTAETSVTFDVHWLKMNEKIKFGNFRTWQHRKEEAWLQKLGNLDINTIVKCLILASLKFKYRNTVKSTKSNLKEEELNTVVHRCSSKQVFSKISEIS